LKLIKFQNLLVPLYKQYQSSKRIYFYLSLVVAPGLGLLRPLLPLSVDRPLSLLSKDAPQSASAF
jgi:hypothetical protein